MRRKPSKSKSVFVRQIQNYVFISWSEILIETETRLWKNKCAIFSLEFISKFGLTTMVIAKSISQYLVHHFLCLFKVKKRFQGLSP